MDITQTFYDNMASRYDKLFLDWNATTQEVPIWKRSLLTVEEAALYSGIGRNKLRSLTDKDDCPFVLWIGRKRLIKREVLDEYIRQAFSI